MVAWRLQRVVRPFAFPFQNVMEAWLLGSSMLLVVLACFYSALDEQVSSAATLSDELQRYAEQLGDDSALSARVTAAGV